MSTDPPPQVSPELAGKVLAAEKRNVIKEVSDGGKLPTQIRKEMDMATLTPEAAAQRRIASLLVKYASGARLTPEELAEIRAAHPDFGVAVPAATPDLATPDPASPAAPPLKLTPEPSPTHGDGEISGEQLARWAALYGVEHRQLRRWIARGKEKGEPCPLDDPASMPAWVDKHLEKVRHNMRDRVQASADAARAAAPPPVADPPAASSDTAGDGVLPAPSPAPAPGVKPLDLASVGGVEGESVELFRSLFAAAKFQLQEAYQSGNEERIAKLHTRVERVGESLRKHELSAEAKARRRGELLEKAEVINEVSHALNTLKAMHEQMAHRIDAEMPELDPETRARLRAAIERVRERELVPLRNLSAFRNPADVLLALAA